MIRIMDSTEEWYIGARGEAVMCLAVWPLLVFWAIVHFAIGRPESLFVLAVLVADQGLLVARVWWRMKRSGMAARRIRPTGPVAIAQAWHVLRGRSIPKYRPQAP